MSAKVLLSWSSGKDSAWALHLLRTSGAQVAGLLTSFSLRDDRVAVHGVPRELVAAQAASAGLPVHEVALPWPCPNAEYERLMREALADAKAAGITHVAFGDLFLEDIRDYRFRLMEGSGLQPLFPVWCGPDGTRRLAREMIDAGLRAVLTCVDTQQLDASFAGREFDRRLLAELPAGVDPCAERGEFHTFCYAGPMFRAPLAVSVVPLPAEDRFQRAELSLR